MPQGHARDTLSCSTSHRRRPAERFWGPGVTRNGLFCGVYFGFGPPKPREAAGSILPSVWGDTGGSRCGAGLFRGNERLSRDVD